MGSFSKNMARILLIAAMAATPVLSADYESEIEVVREEGFASSPLSLDAELLVFESGQQKTSVVAKGTDSRGEILPETRAADLRDGMNMAALAVESGAEKITFGLRASLINAVGRQAWLFRDKAGVSSEMARVSEESCEIKGASGEISLCADKISDAFSGSNHANISDSALPYYTGLESAVRNTVRMEVSQKCIRNMFLIVLLGMDGKSVIYEQREEYLVKQTVGFNEKAEYRGERSRNMQKAGNPDLNQQGRGKSCPNESPVRESCDFRSKDSAGAIQSVRPSFYVYGQEKPEAGRERVRIHRFLRASAQKEVSKKECQKGKKGLILPSHFLL